MRTDWRVYSETEDPCVEDPGVVQYLNAAGQWSTLGPAELVRVLKGYDEAYHEAQPSAQVGMPDQFFAPLKRRNPFEALARYRECRLRGAGCSAGSTLGVPEAPVSEAK